MRIVFRNATALAALALTTFGSPDKPQAACSVSDKVALAKAGYSKTDIEKQCGAEPVSPPQPMAKPEPVGANTGSSPQSVQPPPSDVLAQHFRGDPTDKAELKAVVKEVQAKLNTLGFGAGTPDGAPGRKTKQAQERLKEAFSVDLAGLPYAEQNRILDHLLASEAGKKYVASVQRLGSLSKKVIPRMSLSEKVYTECGGKKLVPEFIDHLERVIAKWKAEGKRYSASQSELINFQGLQNAIKSFRSSYIQKNFFYYLKAYKPLPFYNEQENARKRRKHDFFQCLDEGLKNKPR